MFVNSAEIYDAIYSFKDYAAEARVVQERIAAHRRSSGRALLDAACGTGKHAEFLRDDYDLTLLDLDAGLLAIAAERLPEARIVQADMSDFDLDQQFDAITCLFSAIGYVGSVERLNATLAAFARHLKPGGVVLVEAWFMSEQFHPGGVHARFVDEPNLKISRMNVSRVEGQMSILDFHYMVGTPEGIATFTEHHELMMFTDAQYQDAFRAAGLTVEVDPEGLTGRALYIGTKALA
ncbi:MAG: class I SAM-dependent methyltransferase [Chloroflexi bacterium]|nr:class I SAM-dependent methyltransferase [Chloroflexota bacterium]